MMVEVKKIPTGRTAYPQYGAAADFINYKRDQLIIERLSDPETSINDVLSQLYRLPNEGQETIKISFEIKSAERKDQLFRAFNAEKTAMLRRKDGQMEVASDDAKHIQVYVQAPAHTLRNFIERWRKEIIQNSGACSVE